MNELIATVLRASQHRFIGRLGRDPETRFFNSGSSVTTATIAINRPGAKKDDGQEPDWFKVEIWGAEGQAFADTLHKGDLVDVFGRVKTESWDDRATGEKRHQLVITADTWAPVGSNAPAKPAPAPAAAAKPAQDWSSGWQGDVSNEKVPF